MYIQTIARNSTSHADGVVDSILPLRIDTLAEHMEGVCDSRPDDNVDNHDGNMIPAVNPKPRNGHSWPT